MNIRKIFGIGNGRAPEPQIDSLSILDPNVRVRSTEKYLGLTVQQLEGLTQVRNKRLVDMDCKGRNLRSFRFYNVILEGCCFDKANLRNLRMSSTDVRQCSFRNADLRDANLGNILEGRRNQFIQVDFTGADMRRTAYISASFEQCTFKDTKLTGVDFQGSTFTRCTFSGTVHDVIFNRNAYKREDLPPNQMEDVDFSGARLRFVDFRNLELDRVRFPDDDEHLVISNYRQTLDRAIERLSKDDDPVAKKLVVVLSNRVKWATATQVQGILNRNDLIKLDDTAPDRFLSAINQ